MIVDRCVWLSWPQSKRNKWVRRFHRGGLSLSEIRDFEVGDQVRVTVYHQPPHIAGHCGQPPCCEGSCPLPHDEMCVETVTLADG